MRYYPLSLLVTLLGCVCLHAQENDHVRIARENAPAVVAVNVVKADGSTFTGTGFVLTQDGLIATARHVTQEAVYTNVTFNNGTVSGEAETVAAAGNVDLALLKIQALHLPTVQVASSANVQPGQPITVIGNPRRLQTPFLPGLSAKYAKKRTALFGTKSVPPFLPVPAVAPYLMPKEKLFQSFLPVSPEKTTKILIFLSRRIIYWNLLKRPDVRWKVTSPKRKFPRTPATRFGTI